jgi:hypothetical protein
MGKTVRRYSFFVFLEALLHVKSAFKVKRNALVNLKLATELVHFVVKEFCGTHLATVPEDCETDHLFISEH